MADDTETNETTGDEPEAPEPTGDAELGEGGKKALEQERKARRESDRLLRDAQARVTELEAADARREVAADKGLTQAQAGFLVGETREELEEHADDMLAAFTDASAAKPKPTARPQEKLMPGASNEDPGSDARSVADRIMGRP